MFGDRILDEIIYEDLNNSPGYDNHHGKKRPMMSANISALSIRLEEASGVAYEYESLTSAGMYLNGKLLLMLGEN